MENYSINPYNIIIFGAKGDLSCKKLIPALFKLEQYSLLHKKTKIIGVGRAQWNDYQYIEIIFNILKNLKNNKININIWNKFKYRLTFCNLDVCNLNDFLNLKKKIYKNFNNIYYFAIPPHTFRNICKGLGKIHLNNQPNKIIVEKPIGESFKSFHCINNTLRKYFQEDQIFRIDHYLGKETILNLLTLRFANPIFYHNWDHTKIDYIQIIVSEQIGIENRWGYFDQIGQMKDMVQNHLLQILTIIAMDPPKIFNFYNLKKEKVKILKSLRPIDEKNIYQTMVKGQYSSGIINGKHVPSYINEIGSNKNSNTETFVAITAYIDNPRWKNVPFYLKTGKRLSEKKSEIIISLKSTPINFFHATQNKKYTNKIKIILQPNEGIKIEFVNKIPDLNSKFKLKNSILKFNYKNSFKKQNIPDAYERLILESMKNDQSLFVSQKEIEMSWKWVDTIIKTWHTKNIKTELYDSGTWGPQSCNNILKHNNHHWDHN